MTNYELLKKLPTKSEINAELSKRSFRYFLEYFWDTIIQEPFVPNWHIDYLCAELQSIGHNVRDRKPKEYDLVINIPPGTTKSTICTVMFPVWCWIIDPSLKFITGSYSSDLSTSHAVKSRDVIRSDKFLKCFPEIKLKPDKDNKTDYENNHTGSRVSTSVGGTSTGKHAHILIVDDPINPKKAASEVERDNANSWMDATLSTRKVDKEVSVTILIMQRLNEGDPTGHILSKPDKKVKHICLPGELSEDVKPIELREKYTEGLLDVKRLNRAVLSDLRTDLGSYGYAGQIMQRPSPEEGGILKKEWFDIVAYQDFLKQVSTPTWQMFIDSAYTEKTTNDPTAILTVCQANNNIYIKESRQLWMEFPNLISEIKNLAALNNASKIYIEPKASGKSIVQQLRRETVFNVMELDSPKDDKVSRLNACAPVIEGRRVILIKGSWNDGFINECVRFPNGLHDDQVDNLSACVNKFFINKQGRRAVAI